MPLSSIFDIIAFIIKEEEKMAVLDLIKKVKVQTLSFEKHPCRDLDMETKVHYLNALALITNEDGKIVEKEEEYLTMLINSFELSADTLSEYIEFAKNPDEAQLVEMMDAFSTKDIKYNLMIDAMLIAQRDGDFSDAEKALIEQYFEMFKISEKEAKDLKYIFELFHAQDGNALFRYFQREKLIKKELFTYLMDYYKIDFNYALKVYEKETLTFKWFKPTFTARGSLWGANSTTESILDGNEISKNPVSNAQFVIFLNAMYGGKYKIDKRKVIVDSKDEQLIINLENSRIIFKNGFFTPLETKDFDKKVTGVTVLGAEEFIKWLSKQNGTVYSLPKLGGYASHQSHRGFYDTKYNMEKKIFNNEICIHSFYKEYGESKKYKCNHYVCLSESSGYFENYKDMNDKMSFRLMR